MSTEKMQASFRLLMLITTPKLAEKALLLFEKGRLPMQIQAYAHGTASREMMDMLGLDSGEKSLLLTVMPKADADDLLVHLRRELRLGLSGSGIAFTVPMSGANKRVLQMVQQLCEEKPRAEIRSSSRWSIRDTARRSWPRRVRRARRAARCCTAAASARRKR